MLLIIFLYEPFVRSFIFLLIKHLLFDLFLFNFIVNGSMVIIFIILMIVTFVLNMVEIDVSWRVYDNSYFICRV